MLAAVYSCSYIYVGLNLTACTVRICYEEQ